MPYQTAFISYRRQSSHAEAAFIHNSLRALGVDVFYDRDDLAAGDLWEARLNEELVNRDCLIVVLAPETLQESYWVPREIQIALTQNKKIIPVFTKGFTFSDAYVPDDLTGLKRYNGIRFDYDIADYAVGQIAKVLEIKVTVNVTTPPAPVKQQNWIGRFLSSQSWQGISAIIGIIGVIIAVIALNASNQSTANTTSTPQPSAVALIPSATSAPTDLPTSTPSHTPTDTPIPEITATTQPTTISVSTGSTPTITLIKTYPCEGTITDSGRGLDAVNEVYEEATTSSNKKPFVRVETKVTVQRQTTDDKSIDWYLIFDGENRLGWIQAQYVILSSEC